MGFSGMQFGLTFLHESVFFLTKKRMSNEQFRIFVSKIFEFGGGQNNG